MTSRPAINQIRRRATLSSVQPDLFRDPEQLGRRIPATPAPAGTDDPTTPISIPDTSGSGPIIPVWRHGYFTYFVTNTGIPLANDPRGRARFSVAESSTTAFSGPQRLSRFHA